MSAWVSSVAPNDTHRRGVLREAWFFLKKRFAVPMTGFECDERWNVLGFSALIEGKKFIFRFDGRPTHACHGNQEHNRKCYNVILWVERQGPPFAEDYLEGFQEKSAEESWLGGDRDEHGFSYNDIRRSWLFNDDGITPLLTNDIWDNGLSLWDEMPWVNSFVPSDIMEVVEPLIYKFYDLHDFTADVQVNTSLSVPLFNFLGLCLVALEGVSNF